MISAILDTPINIASPNNFKVEGFGVLNMPNGKFAKAFQSFWKRKVEGLPLVVKRHLYTSLKRRVEYKKNGELNLVENLKYAAINLRDTLNRFNSVINKDSLWLLRTQSIDNRVKQFTTDTNEMLAGLVGMADGSDDTYHALLMRVSLHAQSRFEQLGVISFPFDLKSIESLEGFVCRCQDEVTIKRHFEIQAGQLKEHIQILLGRVGKHANPYCSKECVREFLANQKQQKQWLQAMYIQDDHNPELVCSLADAVKSSVSNPVNRRNELMTRIRGFEDLAADQEYSATFVTITAPAKYHVNSGRKYNGATPRQTQAVLAKSWRNCRSKLKRHELAYYGLRVVEPHADSTPHWHMILFCKPDVLASIKRTIETYATREDSTELTDIEARCKFVDIDPAQGSATGYIAKYISKNIDASYTGQLTDDETGKTISEHVADVRAWASKWNIRQFQFLGGAPVSVWRELRRFMNDFSIEDIKHQGYFKGSEFLSSLNNACESADSGKWAEFVTATGGVFQGKSGSIKTLFQKQTNQFGEVVKKIKGFIYRGFEFVTRENNWRITDTAGLLTSGGAASWSADNKCSGHSDILWQQIHESGSRLSQLNNSWLESEPILI